MNSDARPIIGLNTHMQRSCRTRTPCDPSQPEWLTIETAYPQCIVEAGGSPILLPAVSPDDATPSLNILDGLVLVGGADYDPMAQGCMRTKWNHTIIPRHQETFDRAITKFAIANRIPILAIGAGMQLLNVCCGGTLSYELSEDFKGTMRHRDGDGTPVRHSLQLASTEGVLATSFGSMCECVTSCHHQAVLDLADCFYVAAVAPDEIIEGFEAKDPNWLAVGVQFHPELPDADQIERLIVRSWIDRIVELSNFRRPARAAPMARRVPPLHVPRHGRLRLP